MPQERDRDRHDDRFDDEKDCPVCFEKLGSGKIYQCLYGHTLCRRCLEGIRDTQDREDPACQKCNSRQWSRNTFAERALGKEVVKCGNKGCEKSMPQKDVRAHEKECHHRKVECPLCPTEFPQELNLSDMAKHFVDVHRVKREMHKEYGMSVGLHACEDDQCRQGHPAALLPYPFIYEEKACVLEVFHHNKMTHCHVRCFAPNCDHIEVNCESIVKKAEGMQNDVVISKCCRVLDAHSSVDESSNGFSIPLSILREVEVEHVHFPLRMGIQKQGTAMQLMLDASKGSVAMDMGRVTKRVTIVE